MNVNHVADDTIPYPTLQRDRLSLIFDRQSLLMHRYHEIEQKNGFFVFHPPADLHDKHHQYRLKDMSWRVTEEISEAVLALDPASHEDEDERNTHYMEEIADAYHFFVELMLLVGWTPLECYEYTLRAVAVQSKRLDMGTIPLECKLMALGEFIKQTLGTSVAITVPVVQLGGAMNMLKNKPWKVTQMMTDKTRFNLQLGKAHATFLAAIIAAYGDLDLFFKTYFKKSEVNRFRQRSAY